MANLAESDITITPFAGSRGRKIVGKQRIVQGTCSFGDGAKTYPRDGITVTPNKWGMIKQLDGIVFFQPGSRGILWDFDRANLKLKGFVGVKDTPFLVVEENVGIGAGGNGFFAYLPAYILALVDADVNAYDVIPSTAAVGANRSPVNFTTGAVQINSAIQAKATYIPQDDTGFFSQGNMAIAESLVVASGSVTLGSAAALIQGVYDSTTAAVLTIVNKDETPGATEVKLGTETQAAGATTLTFNSARNGDTVLVTYLKYSGLDVTQFPYVASAVINLSSEAIDFLNTTGYKGLALPTLGTRVVGRDGASTGHSMRLGGPSATAANTLARWDPQLNKITTADTTAVVDLRMPLLLVDPDFRNSQSSRELQPRETPTSATFDFVATGW